MLKQHQQGFAVISAPDYPVRAADDEQVRLLLDATSDGAWDWDIAAGVCFCSPQWLERVGYGPEPLPDYLELLQTIVHPDDYPAVATALHAHLRGETEAYRCEYRHRSASGTWLWNLDRGRVVERDRDGGALRMVGTATDISERKHAEDRLRENAVHYRHFIEVNPAIFWTSDPKGHVTIASDEDARMLGSATNLDDISGYVSLVHPDDRTPIRAKINSSLASGAPMDLTYRLWMRGQYRWVHTQGHARRDAAGRILRWYGSSMDIHRRKTAEDELRTLQQRLTLALDGNRVGVWDWNILTDEFWLSESAYALQGYAVGEVEAESFRVDKTIHPDDIASVRKLLRTTLSGSIEQFVSEHRVRTKEGTWLWVLDRAKVVERNADGRAARMVGTRTDVDDRKKAEERINWLANHDSLTDLPNRAHFQEELQRLLSSAKRSTAKVGLLLLDLDGFKEVNDTAGHDAGDMLLQTFAERLRTACGDGHSIARIGGDEFAVILGDLKSKDDLTREMAAIADKLRAPFMLDGRMLDCCAGIGGSIYPDHGQEPDTLLKSADIALYVAKSRGRAETALFSPEMRSAIHERTAMIRTAREAIDHDRIVPFYQPKIALGSGQISGFEALLRWRDAKGHFQAPGSISAAFKDLDLASMLADRMLNKVVSDITRWLDEGVNFGHVAINASAAEFRRDDFGERVLDKLQTAGIPSGCLELEVTETVFLGHGAEYVERALRLLSDNGVRIALDDFGTGYASLTHLKQFPVDTIKIDQSFIRDLENDEYDAAIVRAVLNLGQSLGIKIVAEGVETPVQAAYLWAQGCGFGQGYLFSKPVPGPQVLELIKQWQPSRP